MMTDPQREALAEYLTGPAVAHASISLQVGGGHKAAAVRFFSLRQAFGVEGYASKDEVLAKLGAEPTRRKR